MKDETPTDAAWGWPKRYTLVLLCVLSIFICYMDRVNISVAIMPMAEEFGWNAQTNGLVLSSFFIGYILTQVLGGRLADRFGGKAVLGIGVLSWSAATLITPPAAALGIAMLVVARILMGAGEGVAFPAIYSLYGRWLPTNERSRVVGLTFSAIPLGSVVALLLTPLVIREFGWGWAFYGFGLLGFVWFGFWHWLIRDKEAFEPVSGSTSMVDAAETDVTENTAAPTLRELVANKAVMVVVLAHFSSNWGTYVLLAWLPTYVVQGLGVDFAAVGNYAMIPYLAAFLFFNVTGILADKLVSRGWQITRVRKTMQTIAFGGAAAMLMLVGYVDDTAAAIALMSMGVLFSAFSSGGFAVNHLDIAPRHAGLLMGLTNTVGTLPGIAGVYISGLILEWTGSWALVFQTAAAVYLIGLIFYLMFASGERQFD